MINENVSKLQTKPADQLVYWHKGRGSLVLTMGVLALLATFVAPVVALLLIGLLLVACGGLEMLETFRAADEPGRRSAYLGGVLSMVAGFALLTRPELVLGGLTVLVGGMFLIDGIFRAAGALGTAGSGAPWRERLGRGVVDMIVGLLVLTGWPISNRKVVGLLAGLRILVAGWSIFTSRSKPPPTPAETPELAQHPDHRLGLPPHPRFAALLTELHAEERSRRPFDAYWCWAFVLTFFAIHIGRMETGWDLMGLFSPLVATVGDVIVALLLAFALVLPFRLLWRKATRPLERRAWLRVMQLVDQGRGLGLATRLYHVWLLPRLRFDLTMVRARASLPAALRWGLQVGLPLTAIFIAINPVWGFSWYFNSENWIAEIWDRWAESRADFWRAQMTRAVAQRYRDHVPPEQLFRVEPEGVAGADDFTFLVLGDTGEGDASQLCLKDTFLALGQRPDVKFLVVSSDVIYPSGALADYEGKFYLPFKGFTKPIYAIPGNHDWYDALEGFAANFLEANAARACMRARVEADGRLTSSTEGRIERAIQAAAWLRQEFGVSTGWQRGPFFEIQAKHFAFVAIDTGVVRRVDEEQWAWLKAALERSRGKFLFALLGHPLYAGGRYKGNLDESFAAVHQLLREHGAEVVMAGDTHYFEHYRETYSLDGGTRTTHHFVNGGGGAYLSIGTPLDWPRRPAVPDCCFYPLRDAVVAKLDAQTPAWKRPLWWWVKHLHAWPSSSEAMAGAFDNNTAPYYQSFVEVRVEGSVKRVRLLPYGANGRLRWRDMQSFGADRPAGTPDEAFVEFVVPIE
ncbi:MAG: metallophosphoesterase [Gemmataceae bacterium]